MRLMQLCFPTGQIFRENTYKTHIFCLKYQKSMVTTLDDDPKSRGNASRFDLNVLKMFYRLSAAQGGARQGCFVQERF